MLGWYEHVVVIRDAVGLLFKLREGLLYHLTTLILYRLLLQTADWREFLHLHLLLMNVLFSSFHLDCRGTLTNFLSGLLTDFIAP